MTVNCTNAPDAVPSDAGVAGIGVLLSFIITAGIALLLSASLILQETRSSSSSNNNRQNPASESVLRRKLLSAYSDQQILTGIGLQGVGLAKASALSPYHFFLVWMLSLLSVAVHNAALLALARDFRRDWVLRWLRQALMLASLALSCAYGVYVLRAVALGLSDAALPIACVWDPATPRRPPARDYALSLAGTVVVIAGNAAIFALATWYLHARGRRFYAAFRAAGLLLMAAFAVGATVRVAYLADAFASGTPVRLSDDGERQWSFGQLLSVGMLLLPLVSAVEILRGEIRCAPPVAREDVDDDKGVLLGEGEGEGGEQRELRNRGVKRGADFQPNPFWGSETNLFKK